MVAIEFIFLTGACLFYKSEQLKSMLTYQIPLNRYIVTMTEKDVNHTCLILTMQNIHIYFIIYSLSAVVLRAMKIGLTSKLGRGKNMFLTLAVNLSLKTLQVNYLVYFV